MVKLFCIISCLLANYCYAQILPDSIQNQFDFLKSLEEEIQSSEQNYENFSQEEINAYRQSVESARASLKCITIEINKEKPDKEKTLKDLVNKFNKELEELKKTYKFLMAKQTTKKLNTPHLANKVIITSTVNSLSNPQKKRQINSSSNLDIPELIEIPREREFAPLELDNLSGNASISPGISKDKDLPAFNNEE
jgi:hypothetical protein